LDETRTREVNAAIAAGQCPSHLALLWSVSKTNPDLFQKLVQDYLIPTYSTYGFFPQVYELVYEKEQPPDVVFDGRTRGEIAIIRDGSAGLVVKPMQNRREDEIAKVAGGLGVGPRQFQSIPAILKEGPA
jgi:hypothetical protein